MCSFYVVYYILQAAEKAKGLVNKSFSAVKYYKVCLLSELFLHLIYLWNCAEHHVALQQQIAL